MGMYGWCKHREDTDKPCYICDELNRKQQEKTRKAHGPKCDCYVCDWGDYWRHLGKQ